MTEERRKLDLGDEPEETTPQVSGYDFLCGSGELRCAFSTSRTIKMGMGANARKHESVIYWYVEQTENGEYEGRKLNKRNVPEGDAETLLLHTLVNDFTPQLTYYEEVVLPAMEALEDILDKADEHREDGRHYSAEMEYDRALAIEERNVRALFGLGLIFAARNEHQRTRELLAQLVKVKAAFDGKNQHLFNEFGIALRKSRLFVEAVVYYRRALDFVTTDENLYYNLARAHYEEGNWSDCLDALIMSHRLNPRLEVAHDLFEVIVGLAEDEERLNQYGKPPVPPNVAARARQILAVETGRLPLDENPILHGGVSDVAQGRARSGAQLMDEFGFEMDIDGFDDD
ncbi:tetratricopeptide repeat protein [Pseudodesulfovibrio sp. zrk46]|uniref:tetratricopeptide repeat protein n=1 Tax=Pseudodesulfovibrio sp. zrk46 TaxID=2725288 RepID=UPI001449CD7E|nr:tetratricopeptide repeat protein [Pseudodesulfovibrio sp. zrk46]QJB55465.1 tetratricopeptide repeat protein [Pseudodesulfovibrio sp. zrk46]